MAQNITATVRSSVKESDDYWMLHLRGTKGGFWGDFFMKREDLVALHGNIELALCLNPEKRRRAMTMVALTLRVDVKGNSEEQARAMAAHLAACFAALMGNEQEKKNVEVTAFDTEIEINPQR